MPSMQLQRLVKRLAIIAGATIGALVLSDAAQALTDRVFRYSTPRNGHLTIDSMAVAPDSNTATYFNDWINGLTVTTERNCFSTGVNLPHSATIVKITVFYSTVTVGLSTFRFLRKRLSDGALDDIAAHTIGNSSGKRKAVSIDATPGFAVVDNPAYSYGLGVCLGKGEYFHSARIHYTYETAGD